MKMQLETLNQRKQKHANNSSEKDEDWVQLKKGFPLR